MVFMVKALVTLVLIISFINLSLTAVSDDEDTQVEVVETGKAKEVETDKAKEVETGQARSKDIQYGARPKTKPSESSEHIVIMNPQDISDDFCLSGSISTEGLQALHEIKKSSLEVYQKALAKKCLDRMAIDIILQNFIDSLMFTLSRIGDNLHQIAITKSIHENLLKEIEALFDIIPKTHMKQLNFYDSMKLISKSNIWGILNYICWNVPPNSELWLHIMNTHEKIDSIYRFVRYVFGNKVFVLFVANVGQCMKTSPDCLNEVQQRVFDLSKDRLIISKLGVPSSTKNLIFLLSVLENYMFKSVRHLLFNFCLQITPALENSETDNILNNDELRKKMIVRLNQDGYSEKSLNSLIQGLNELKSLREHSAAV